jgi:type III secretory pathway component EscT
MVRDRMANSEENKRQIAARRLAHILTEHGIAQPQKHAFTFILIGILIGFSIGLLIGWLIWT